MASHLPPICCASRRGEALQRRCDRVVAWFVHSVAVTYHIDCLNGQKSCHFYVLKGPSTVSITIKGEWILTIAPSRPTSQAAFSSSETLMMREIVTHIERDKACYGGVTKGYLSASRGTAERSP
jgi:hypothetical protein